MYFSDDVKCISHLYCAHFCRIFKISTQQLINCALSGLSISGRNSTSPNICSLPPLQIILILLSCSSSIRSWVSQVCPAAVLDLNQCLYLPDIHTSAAPPNVHTLPTRAVIGAVVRQHRDAEMEPTQFLTICESKHAIGEKTALEI